MKQSGGSVKFSFAELKKDREVALAAVHECWDALEYAAAELKEERDVALAAVKQYGGA